VSNLNNKKGFVWIVILLLAVGGYLYFRGQPEKEIMSEPDKVVEESSEMVKTYVDVSVETAKMMIEENPEMIIIDVSPKYKEGHLPGSINYYVGDGSLDKAIPNLDMNAKYLVYCHTDEASMLGAKKLVDAGFVDVSRLVGNYAAWIEAGYEIEK